MSIENIPNEELNVVTNDEINSDDSNWSDIEASIIKEAILKAQNDTDTENENADSDSDFDSDSDSFGEAPIESEKLVLDEQGYTDSDPLPLGWNFIQHASGLKIYINCPEKVCTAARPYFLGTGSVRKHNIPRSAIPCLSYINTPEDTIPTVEDVGVAKNIVAETNTTSETNVFENNTNITDTECLENALPVQTDVSIVENITTLGSYIFNTVGNVGKKQTNEIEQNIAFELNFCINNAQDDDFQNLQYLEPVEDYVFAAARIGIEVSIPAQMDIVSDDDQIPCSHLQKNYPTQEFEAPVVENISVEHDITMTDILDSNDEDNFISDNNVILIQDDDSNDLDIIEENIDVREVVIAAGNIMQENNIFSDNSANSIEDDDLEGAVIQDNVVILINDDCAIVEEVAINDDVVLVENSTEIDPFIDDCEIVENIEKEVTVLEHVALQNEMTLSVNGTREDVDKERSDVSVAVPENIPNDFVKNLNAEELDTYCRKLFHFKKIRVMRFNSWSERRQFSKRRKHVHQLHKTAPLEPKVIIKCPVQSKSGESSKKWLMNTAGKSHVCILHEYVQHSLKKQPKYSFSELENAATPYAATVTINNMKYGVGYGTSKKQAKSNAAKATLQILIPEMDKSKPAEEGANGTINEEADITNVAFFDTISILDPRVSDFSAKTTEPLPCDLLKSCLNRNQNLGDMSINYEDNGEDQEMKFTMTVGPHQVTVFCKNKREAKQQAAQAILQKLHPHVHSWGALLRLYCIGSCMGLKEKLCQKPTEQIPTLHLPQEHQVSSPTVNCNAAIMCDLKNKFNSFMTRGLKREYDENVRPLLIADLATTI